MAKIESPAAKQFMSKLQSGQYSDLANAKRAIGRAVNVTPEEKAQCLKAAEKMFSGAARPPATKNGKAKAVVKKAAKKAVAKPSNTKKKVAKKAAKKKAVRKSAASTPPAEEPTEQSLDVQERRIGFLTASIDAMKKAKEVSPDINIGPGPQKACEALGAIINQIHHDVLGPDAPELEGPPADPDVVARLEQTSPPVEDAPPQSPPFGTS
jgi:hypothetical protein